MSAYHAVVFVDHHTAHVMPFGADTPTEPAVHEHRHYTRQHGSEVRSEHEFYAQVCDALEGITEVLVVGGHTGLADFRHYVEKHRPLTAQRIVGYEVVDHPSEPQMVALARQRFARVDRMAGIHVPT